jgi:hypothetical protein
MYIYEYCTPSSKPAGRFLVITFLNFSMITALSSGIIAKYSGIVVALEIRNN